MNRPYPLYDLPWISSLKDMIRQQVDDDANRVAFRFREGRGIAERTIGEFLADIDALGTWLFHWGVRDVHVALAAPNSYLWLVVYFAAISGGIVIVPIDKDLPSEEMARLVRHSECGHAFAADRLADGLCAALPDVKVFPMSDVDGMLEQGRALLAAGERAYLDYEQDVNRLSTIVYTSGTTGGSKGVMLSQANLLADINHGCRLFKPEGASMSVLPYHHMFGLVVALMMLVHWRTTVFINTSLKYLLPDFQEARPQTTMFVPLHLVTFHRMIMEKAKKEGKYKKLRAGMKLSLMLYGLGIDVRKKLMKQVRQPFGGALEYVLVGGAALDPFYEREYRAWGIDLITAYGATECSPGIAASRNFHRHEGSVGLPVGACEVRIAEDGEVMIRGGIVMMGYWRDEAATAQALKDGWYASGDLGYIDRGGFLYLTGRKKNLIVLSDGENVSPEKLESQIGLIEGVLEVVVYEEGDAITAEIFPDEAHRGMQEYFEDRLREYSQTLPPSQRIRQVRLREAEFPKNTSRKILRYEVRKEKDHA